MTKREVRIGEQFRFQGDGACRIVGHAAVFNTETMIGDFFREVVMPGAFSAAIGRDDVEFLINHRGEPLARTTSGTLTLAEDDRGLLVNTELDDDDPDVQRLVPKLRRGDMSQMSFGFHIVREEWDSSDEIALRTIHEVELVDVSVVNRGAYPTTDVALRSLERVRSRSTRTTTETLRLRAAALSL